MQLQHWVIFYFVPENNNNDFLIGRVTKIYTSTFSKFLFLSIKRFIDIHCKVTKYAFKKLCHVLKQLATMDLFVCFCFCFLAIEKSRTKINPLKKIVVKIDHLLR